MNIYLVGLPGSGKSTLGKKLAEELDFAFVDLDDLIEEKEGKSIAEIFEVKGEDYFRKIERQLLRSTSAFSRSTIIATGGGTPCFFKQMQWINENGFSIYLNVDLQTILDRVSTNEKRPLLATNSKKERLQQLLAEREKHYLQAKLHLKELELKGSFSSITDKIRNSIQK